MQSNPDTIFPTELQHLHVIEQRRITLERLVGQLHEHINHYIFTTTIAKSKLKTFINYKYSLIQAYKV